MNAQPESGEHPVARGLRLMSRTLAAVTLLTLSACATHPGTVTWITRAPEARPVVMTQSGPVLGAEAKGARAFLGIPYAAPPVGDLRWRAPHPVAPWLETREATRIGVDCTQALGRKAILGGGGGFVRGSEDCLYLNVYAPAGEASTPRPVMVYLHGGAFTIGSGANYDPTLLAVEQDRVVVTVNYRLGALGWLAHPAFADESDPSGVGGNFGLMDQQVALRWVRDNIAAFGGDPGDVTLFAESSGAWSACYLMASPGSAGLWSRVILQSGPCLEPNSLVSAPVAAAAGPAFAASVECDQGDVVACLRRLPASTIARAASTRSGINGPGSWGPVFGDALVPVSPPEAFASGTFVQTPVIIGSNAAEGRLFATEVRSLDRFQKETVWMYGLTDGPRVLARYPVGADGPAIAIAQGFTDSRFACPSNAMRRLLARHVPVHGYEFADADAPIVLPSWITGLKMGAYHASELTYVFGRRWAFADPARFTPEQAALSARMRSLWAGFGHDGNFDARWPKAGSDGGGGPVLMFKPEGDTLDAEFVARHQCELWDGSLHGAVEPPAG